MLKIYSFYFIASLSFPLSASEISGTVTKVLDGDTFDVRTNQQCNSEVFKSLSKTRCDKGFGIVRVRLSEVDAPESKQEFGTESKNLLHAAIYGKHISIKNHKSDRYGRLLGSVYQGDVWINRFMVEEGAAWVYTAYAKNNKILMRSQKVASENGKGLWGYNKDKILPPWEWRKNN
jgi:endonuclease YncB( thermonuclease family)